MELVPVRMKIPQVLKAEWIWEIVVRDSGEEKESEVKRGVESMTGTWLILSDGLCFVGMEEERPKPGSLSYVLCLTAPAESDNRLGNGRRICHMNFWLTPPSRSVWAVCNRR